MNEKPDPVRGFLGAQLIVVGVLMMFLCGTCGAASFILIAVGTHPPPRLTSLMVPVLLGGVPALIGWGLFVLGRRLQGKGWSPFDD